MQLPVVVLWLTIVGSVAAWAAAFFTLLHLGNDPRPGLADAYRTAAYLQCIPYITSILLAVFLRRRPHILSFTFVAVAVCGGFGWWWLDDLVATRRWENQPVTRNALGNIFPDIEGQIGCVEAFIWPFAATTVIGVVTLIGWAVVRAGNRGTPVSVISDPSPLRPPSQR